MPWSDYQRVQEIGSGSMARAYLVRVNPSSRLADKKMLVMKEIDFSRMDSRERKNAEIEVQVLSSFKHPYIVRYHESFVHDHHVCIVMDYCEGGDLWQFVAHRKRQRAPLGEPQVLRWFTQMCLALKYMHDKNVLHRDIKTQNIFLAKKLSSRDGSLGVVKIADFGISKVLDSQTALANTRVGTPYYLSPEICQNQPYAMPSDMWALGCVLFELCVLHVPFEAQDLPQLVEKIVCSRIAKIPDSYSRDLCVIVMELLSREACRRPSAEKVIQKPLIQSEIKIMIAEDKRPSAKANENNMEDRRPSTKENGMDDRRDSARERGSSRSNSQQARPVLQEYNHNPREMPRRSASKSSGSRAPSPHREVAKQLLRQDVPNSARHSPSYEFPPQSARHEYRPNSARPQSARPDHRRR